MTVSLPSYIFPAVSHRRLLVTASRRRRRHPTVSHRRRRFVTASHRHLRTQLQAASHHRQPSPHAAVFHLAWSSPAPPWSASAASHRRHRRPPGSSRSDTKCRGCTSQPHLLLLTLTLRISHTMEKLRNTRTYTDQGRERLCHGSLPMRSQRLHLLHCPHGLNFFINSTSTIYTDLVNYLATT